MLVIYDERDLRSCTRKAGASTALENLLQATDGLLLKIRTFRHIEYFPDVVRQGRGSCAVI